MRRTRKFDFDFDDVFFTISKTALLIMILLGLVVITVLTTFLVMELCGISTPISSDSTSLDTIIAEQEKTKEELNRTNELLESIYRQTEKKNESFDCSPNRPKPERK